MIIDHIGLTVSDFAVSNAFYTACLKPLNIALIVELEEGWVGFGRNDEAGFWFGPAGPDEQAQQPMHIAFVAQTRAEVDAFYASAIASGGQCNGKPGLREIYHPNYYGAFVTDPDGHNIEAVCHSLEINEQLIF